MECLCRPIFVTKNDGGIIWIFSLKYPLPENKENFSPCVQKLKEKNQNKQRGNRHLMPFPLSNREKEDLYKDKTAQDKLQVLKNKSKKFSTRERSSETFWLFERTMKLIS